MSNPQNIQRKILVNNPLKTNFISNTNNKNKAENQKRFSNIARQKQTVQKNAARYYEQIDMQGSATIIPQKNTARQNIYINQNTNHNLPLNFQNQPQRKQYPTQPYNTINIKSKSPGENGRLAIEQLNKKMQQFSIKPNQIHMRKNSAQMNNFINKNIESQTQRDQPSKSYLIKDIKDEQKQVKPKKSIIVKTIAQTEVDDDMLCDEQFDIQLPTERNEKKQPQKILQVSSPKFEYGNESCYNKTEKKYIINNPAQQPNLYLERTKSQHTLITKQPTILSKNYQSSNNPHLYFNANINRQNSKPQFSPIINYEEELKKFKSYQVETNILSEIQKLEIISNRHKLYSVQPNYIEMRQKNFNWFMRAVLMDWMVHVCFEFSLKRQTYYISVCLADKYLEQTTDLPKSQFQLVGAASMYISAKLEQFQALSGGDFSKSTDNRYSANDIKQMQLKISKALNFELNPPTLYMWTNRFMAHWDNYIMLTDAKQHPYFDLHQPKYFKKDSQQSYLLFRQMMQMLDCAILDVQTLQFPPKILVCSFMYLVLGKNYKQWSVKRIIEEFPRTSYYLVSEDDINCFNNLFHMFLIDSFNINILELLPAVQYCSTYFSLPLIYDQPSIAGRNETDEQNPMSLQEYESFQTYNAKMIEIVKKRYRGVYL